MADVEKLIRPGFAAMRAYTPILPADILSERFGVPEERVIKLDGNENPYGCSPRVKEALQCYAHYNIYPDPEQRVFRAALAGYVGMGEDYLIGGAGSDELIDLVLRLFLEPGDRVIDCPPTFGMYHFCTEICGGKTVDIRRRGDFSIDAGAVKKAVDSRTKVIFVTSPNNPSGNITAEKDILDLLETGVVVVVDEAYYEFSGVTVAPLVARHDNLIVLRSFSKWAGLAGLRVGYGIFSPRLVPYLMKIKQPYNINAAAQVAVLESLKDIDNLRAVVRKLIAERGRLFEKLSELAFLKPYPSQANFILCSVAGDRAHKIYEALQKAGIFIRYFDTPLLKDCIRISIGKPEHTDAVIDVLRKVA
ncbi:MAG: histidinol-phosphate aminotransferase, partial [Dehalococcoidia bacterium]|nr:histidinol-phosphate aminotransferase [Dehalococcoidia bacterium]